MAGWVHRRRDHGGLIFIDLRDRSGLVQLVVHPQSSGDAFAIAEDLRSEHVISAEGEIVKRAPENVNPNLATGEIEIHVRSLERLAASETPPFPVDEDTPVDEMIRLQHRMIDLRRENMREAMQLRHRIIATMRDVLNERDFLEIETPILTRSTPEGARDFLVPSRLQPGSWYALPQSPQLFKQLLDDERLRALLPDRALLPRRGPARRPPARVHPARRRDGASSTRTTSWTRWRP